MRRFVVSASISLFVVGVLAGVVSALTWAGYVAGSDSTVALSQFSLTTEIHDAVHWNGTDNLAPTDLSVTFHHEESGKEASVYDDTLGSTPPPGLQTCTTWASGNTECSEADIEINLDAFGATLSQHEARWVICHEFGHIVGLAHTSSPISCVNGTIYDASTDYTDHDEDHINDNY